MAAETNNGMQCSEFEAVLSEALDGQLTGTTLERFQSHARQCQVCGPVMEEAEAGRNWLRSLHEVEAPPALVQNILAATTGIDTVRLRSTTTVQPQVSWMERMRERLRLVFSPVFNVARQPRFAMSFGMAFFSLSVGMSISGVKVADLRHADLRPSAIRRNYYETSGRVKKYYENIRVVYELESRVREFKRATTPAEPAPEEKQNRHRKDDTSGEPQLKQERNYSQGENQPVLASCPLEPPGVLVTTYRRFV